MDNTKTLQKLLSSADTSEVKGALTKIAQKFAEGMFMRAPPGMPPDFGVVIVAFTNRELGWTGASDGPQRERVIAVMRQALEEMAERGVTVDFGA